MKKKIFVVILVLVVIVGVAGLWGYHIFFSSAVSERFTIVLRADENYEKMTE